ncbi:MAG: SGNH/GDSL hydrolase family protein [Nocardioides sp.]
MASSPRPRGVRVPAAMVLAATLVGLTACSPTTGVNPVSSEPTTTSTSTATPFPSNYVAMGDSYTAAPLFPLVEETEIDACLNSDLNYPSLVARSLEMSVTDVSCSGASTVSMFYEQKFTSESRPPQLDALSSDTDLVTLGIGANDSNFFAKMIFTCLRLAERDPAGAPCRERNLNSKGKDKLERQLIEIERNVARVVRSIGKRAPNARIFLVGYPQLLPSEGTCRAKLPLARGDYVYTRDLNLRLADSVRDGGVRAGAEYVDLVAASQGHDICSHEPWVAGVRGDPKRAMGLHPYPAEQRAVADLIIAML